MADVLYVKKTAKGDQIFCKIFPCADVTKISEPPDGKIGYKIQSKFKTYQGFQSYIQLENKLENSLKQGTTKLTTNKNLCCFSSSGGSTQLAIDWGLVALE